MIRKLFSILLLILPFVFTIPVRAAIVINELYPKSDTVAWEYVELYNTGSDSVSLNQWKLDHTAGDAKSFILPASAIIEPHGFLTFGQSQTAITFSTEGDTVRLFDVNGALIDSQSYPGTLGYNTSMGRSIDGGGVWAICTAATPRATNSCPQPSPTATPVPTHTPTPTLKPTATPQPKAEQPPAVTPAPQTFGSLLPSTTPSEVLGAATMLTPTPTPAPSVDVLQFKIAKPLIAYILLGIAAAALSLMLVLWLRHRWRLRSSKP